MAPNFVTTMDQLMGLQLMGLQLIGLYEQPSDISIAKAIDHISDSDHSRAFIEAAPFFALATGRPGGLDCAPRGDEPGFVRVADRKTLMVPDRRGQPDRQPAQHHARSARVALPFLVRASARPYGSWVAPRSRSIRT
jgi:uncharacterized protein